MDSNNQDDDCFKIEETKSPVDFERLHTQMSLQEEKIVSKPAQVSQVINKFLTFHMSVLDLEPKSSTCVNQTGDLTKQLSPKKVNFVGAKPRDVQVLKLASLKVLSLLFKHAKKSKLFAYWYCLLPRCPNNPSKRGILELVEHPDWQIRESTLNLMSELFSASTVHLQLANAHCRSGSFTPVCLEFALALGRLVNVVSEVFQEAIHLGGHPSHVSHVSHSLIVLLENMPFNRLEDGLLSNLANKLLWNAKSDGNSNPVVQIAVLQVCSAMLSISPPNPEIAERFSDFFGWCCSKGFPAATDENSEVKDAAVAIDNNIRYVSIQNIGRLASLDPERFLTKAELLARHLEAAIKSDKDPSIVIHVLRLIKTIGKCSNGIKEDSEAASRLFHFWLLMLKPSLLQDIEARDCPILKSGLCDCLAEIGGSTFGKLPADKRNLVITFMLNKCRESDHRTVTSACRGIGMMVSFSTLQGYNDFLVDCGEILLTLLSNETSEGSGQKKQTLHRNVFTSATWALANLADSLAKQRQTLDESESFASGTRPIGDDFPPLLILQLIRISVGYAGNPNNHMNIRSNSVRSLGSMLQCLDCLMKWEVLKGNEDVKLLCDHAVRAVCLNISTGKVMKVRWNACYAAGGILKTQRLFGNDCDQKRKLIDSLLPTMEECANFKVRINAALALTSVESRQVFGDHFTSACVTTCRALESGLANVEDADEIQHRTELIDQLCLTFAHLVSLASPSDASTLENSLVDYADVMESTMKAVMMRISPEKATIFVNTRRTILDNCSTQGSSQIKMSDQSSVLQRIFPNSDEFSPYC